MTSITGLCFTVFRPKTVMFLGASGSYRGVDEIRACVGKRMFETCLLFASAINSVFGDVAVE